MGLSPSLGISPEADAPAVENHVNFPPPPTMDPGVTPLSVDQMEAILSRQLESSIQQIARKLLPELAERIIKEEINRMLREQP
jgi:hypothetical protein